MKRSDTNINVVLAKKGINTDKELASVLGMSTAALSNRLCGDVSMDTLEKLSHALGVEVFELLKKPDYSQ